MTGPSNSPTVDLLRQNATTYRDNHHWVPLRLRGDDGKNPKIMGEGWQKRTLSDPVPKFETGDNIGVLLGPPSGDLVRLDPDYPSIPDVTRALFPEPSLKFGRKSSPGSGRLLTCRIKTMDFNLPEAVEGDPRLPLHNKKPSLIVFQILSTGKQTVVPPSWHWEKKENVVWEDDASPLLKLESKELIRRVGIEAFCMAVRQFWPAVGKRNEAAMALARVLLEALPDDDDERRIALVDTLVLAVAMAGGDGEASSDGKERAEATLTKMRAGEETTGMPRLIELLELPEGSEKKVIKTFRKWLNLKKSPWTPPAGGASLEDFRAYLPKHSYIFTPTRELWPAGSVNVRLGKIPLFNRDGSPRCDENGDQEMMPASVWLDLNQAVEQMTWAPGFEMVIPDRLMVEAGWIEKPGAKCFNLYRPPIIIPGNAKRVLPWFKLMLKVFKKKDVKHMVKWFAHKVQHPGDKINHALVLGGAPGIGKDSILEPVKRTIGPWNFQEVNPQQTLGRFNGFLKSVILRVSEVRDLGEMTRYQFYNHMKSYTAAPPDTLRCDEKNLKEHQVLNCTAVVYTTNHKTDGLHLPPEDRRHHVAWSDIEQKDFADGYWKTYYRWLDDGGDRHVAAYLLSLDISDFDPKAPPPKTEAFWEIVNANRAPEDAELADAIDNLIPNPEGGEEVSRPDAITIDAIEAGSTSQGFKEWIKDRGNRRIIPHRLSICGYVPIRNPDAKDELWKIEKTRQVIYVRKELTVAERLKAAKNLVKKGRPV
jgi:Family of unknown function (DUF5906)